MHLNFRSRALERGRVPDQPSYFLKPPSTLAESGDPVVRPRGCELLSFEGEIALVLGRRCHDLAPERAWQEVAFVTAADDFGVYDLRYADAGSNLRSKGIDGYTPLGPRLLPAAELDPSRLRVRTFVNGRLTQEGSAEELIFDFGRVLADLTRLMTLEEGDVILTGTPAGSTVVVPGDLVEVEVDVPGGPSSGRLVTPVVEADRELAAIGAMPRVDAQVRELAYGPGKAPGGDAEAVPQAVLSALGQVSSATVASQLHRRGLDGLVMDGLLSSRPELAMVGRARTILLLPRREDLQAPLRAGLNSHKRGIEEVEPGDVVVISCGGLSDAGTIGDILAQRAEVRGASGIVTEGAARDLAALSQIGIPVYHRGASPAILGRRHMAWETGLTVACAGVTVRPGDVLLGDADGVVVIPFELAAEVAEEALEQERQERFISLQVGRGEPLAGLFPLGEAWAERYRAWAEGEGSS